MSVMNNDDDLSPEEREALQSMRLDETPPPRLEHEIVRALRRDGLLDDPPAAYVRGRRWSWLAAASAAAVAVLTTWMIVRRPGQTLPASEGPRFVLLLYGGEPRGSGPSRHDEYAAWAREIAAHGTAISGEELAEDAVEITRGSSPVAAEAPPQPRGYFVIAARDADAARAIAETCPHLSYGGRVILRRIAP